MGSIENLERIDIERQEIEKERIANLTNYLSFQEKFFRKC